MSEKIFVAMAGNIGCGKTTAAKLVSQHFGFELFDEPVIDNRFLKDYYQDMQRWSFHLQVFFLGHRAQQHLDLFNNPQSAISDRSIYEDAFIFARALHHMNNLNERDYLAYRQVFDIIVRGLPAPNLLLYLKCPVSVLMDRIQQRGREMESGITADYLQLLDSFYEEWLATFDLCPVLTIPTDDLNFVQKPKHLDIVVEKIQEKLAGKEDVVFPANGGE